MSVLLIIAWLTVFIIMIRAVYMKDILWPQKQEDREEGGWKQDPEELRACDTRTCEPGSAFATGASGIRQRGPGLGSSDQLENDEKLDLPVSNASGMIGHVEEGGSLPAIPERLIEESVRGRTPKVNDDMV